jgi:hypothetical protein
MTARIRTACLAILVIAAAACQAGPASEPAGASASATGASPSPAASPAASSDPQPSGSAATTVDLAVDSCAFLDIAVVQQLTGVSEDFLADGRKEPAGTQCFWGATRPGVPGYVEISAFRQPSIPEHSFGDGCTVTPVSGVGSAAEFVVCTGGPQDKIGMLAFDDGVAVTLLVNEPAGVLTADDLGPVIQSIYDQLR